MTMHRIIVSLMLILSTVSALVYVSTFPTGADDASSGITPAQLLESGSPAPAPADNMPADQRRLDMQALRHLA